MTSPLDQTPYAIALDNKHVPGIQEAITGTPSFQTSVKGSLGIFVCYSCRRFL